MYINYIFFVSNKVTRTE